MKKYIYSGKSNLTFSHGKNDYLVHGKGPHELPEDSGIVRSHLQRGTLTVIDNKDKPKK